MAPTYYAETTRGANDQVSILIVHDPFIELFRILDAIQLFAILFKQYYLVVRILVRDFFQICDRIGFISMFN